MKRKYKKTKGRGWFNDRYQHAVASKGISLKNKNKVRTKENQGSEIEEGNLLWHYGKSLDELEHFPEVEAVYVRKYDEYYVQEYGDEIHLYVEIDDFREEMEGKYINNIVTHYKKLASEFFKMDENDVLVSIVEKHPKEWDLDRKGGVYKKSDINVQKVWED